MSIALWDPSDSSKKISQLSSGEGTVAYSGASYGHVGHVGRGVIGSIFDGRRVSYNAQMQAVTSGDKAKRINIGKDQTVEFNKKLFMADNDGNITIVNGDLIDHKLKMIKEQHEYVSQIMEYMVYTDELASEALGIDPTVYDKLFKINSTGTVNGQDMQFGNFEARASHIQALPETSEKYIQAITKIRWIVTQILPVHQRIKMDQEEANI